MQTLADFKDPETGRSIVQMEQVRDIRIDSDSSPTLGLTTHSAPLWQETKSALEKLLRNRFPQLKTVQINLVVHARPPQKLGSIGLTAEKRHRRRFRQRGRRQKHDRGQPGAGIARAGRKSACSMPMSTGPAFRTCSACTVSRSAPAKTKSRRSIASGMKVISMGFFVPPGEAVVWRGPMLHGAITQLLRDTAWGELDYLIIDMPPGTGDIALTLSQLLPLTGAVVVCTPQDVALLDAVKAIAMFRKVNIPVLGVVENMSYFICPDCGKRYDIFGHGGAKRRAEELGIPFLGEVPINISIRVHGDEGRSARTSTIQTVPHLEEICYRLVKNLASNIERRRRCHRCPTL